jgi:hypothetical protein
MKTWHRNKEPKKILKFIRMTQKTTKTRNENGTPDVLVHSSYSSYSNIMYTGHTHMQLN